VDQELDGLATDPGRPRHCLAVPPHFFLVAASGRTHSSQRRLSPPALHPHSAAGASRNKKERAHQVVDPFLFVER